MTKLIRCVVLALMLAPAPVVAQDLDAGGAAFNSGDYATALREWIALAEQGNVKAQNNVAVMYENGFGVPQDYAEAVKWYRLAAEQGHARAMFALAGMYANGNGVRIDSAEAVKWYRRAAEQGLETSQRELGQNYRFGRGAKQDLTTAHMWLNIAAANGDNLASHWRDGLENELTSEAVIEAQNRARRCMESNYQDCD